MNSVFEYLFLRRPKLDYKCPPFCEVEFSGSGEPIIILDPFGRLVAPSGFVLSGENGLHLSWNVYPGALCYSVYRAVDCGQPTGAYEIIAECIEDNFIELPSHCFYRVSAITPDGESELSDPIDATNVPPPPPPPPPPPCSPFIDALGFVSPTDLE